MRLSAAGLVSVPVYWHRLRVGRVTDVILTGDATRAVGLDVSCGDGFERFLPLSAGRPLEEAVELVEPLALSEPESLSFYRRNGASLARLLAAGRVGDLVLDADGAVVSVVPAARQPQVRSSARAASPASPSFSTTT